MPKFDTPAAITARVDIPAGHIRFIAADRADTVVEVRPADAARSRDTKAAERVEVAYADGVLDIRAAKGPRSRLLGDSGSVEITVQLPAGSHVEAKAGAAEFRGVGRLGNVVFEGGYRSVKLDEAASARLTAHDGAVTVRRLTGPGDLSTQRGDVTVHEATGGALTLTTQLGDITVGAARGVAAVLDAGTVLGRVANTLRNDGTPALTIRATTTKGDITAHSL
ncbi:MULTISPECIES: DUF4097 family beta strand repeat-containing protein [unclassified Streptomyces]|uniref:DUF4097 family beta strand repeat-containing protein n=1 Tax=unclassified Streptomyces TaxID=2593676 RepID=UPI000DAD361C|nr:MULTISPECIES: DUF4097 family beta strand repeat-containing protein [unclassified Streptomyces]PZT72414.1 hypothetical protein DNK55_28195 [Streptomyces sp. AC1-42T]PZT81267.1 hypothetical protein DNK56_03375 [Streptomyces sp. AC1-42W]